MSHLFPDIDDDENEEVFQTPCATVDKKGNCSHIGGVRSAIVRFEKKIEKNLDRIYTQVSKTNGRVNALELWKANAEGFVNGVKSSGKAVGHIAKVLFLVAGAIISWVFNLFM